MLPLFLLGAFILQLSAPINADSMTALFRVQRDACFPQSSAVSRFSGRPNLLDCIGRCASAQSPFDTVQTVFGASQLDCECVLTSPGTPVSRSSCERWDLQSVNNVPYVPGMRSSTSWLLNNCPYFVALSPNSYPVVDVNKCVYLNSVAAATSAMVTSSGCLPGSQLFNLKDSISATLLAKYLTYIKEAGVSLAPYWVLDSRSGISVVCSLTAANLTTLGDCNVEAAVSRYPICEKTLFFADASVSDILVVNSDGSTSITWYYFSSISVPKNQSCVGSQLASITSNDTFYQWANFYVSRNWAPNSFWISSSNYLTYYTGVGPECIIFRAPTYSYLKAQEDWIGADACTTPHRQICMVQSGLPNVTNNGTSIASKPTAWLNTSFCPLAVQPPTDAQRVRTIGNRCFFYTLIQYSSSALQNTACGNSIAAGSAAYIPAQISTEYLQSRSYVLSIQYLIDSYWKGWMGNNGWNGIFVDGYVIKNNIMGPGYAPSYFLNSTGGPFKDYPSNSYPVICRSSQQVCDSALNYWNYLNSTNSCVAVETTGDGANYNQSVLNCAAKSGALLKLGNDEKVNQITELLLRIGYSNLNFWFDAASGNCSALQASSVFMNLTQYDSPCNTSNYYLCEKPFM